MKTNRKPVGHVLVFALMFIVACGDSPPPGNGNCNYTVPPGSIVQVSSPGVDATTRSDTATGTVSAPCNSTIVVLAQFA